MKVVVIIQARMGSTRLPGKVLKKISGKPMLAHVINRVLAARGIDYVCIATTKLSRDKTIVNLAKEMGVHVFKGDEDDVLSRYHGAAQQLEADLIVRVTSDCPLYDPTLLDEMLIARDRLVRENHVIHYYSNTLNRTYPRGLDTEILTRSTLERIVAEATDPKAREHVTWHIYQHPDTYKLKNHSQPDHRDDSSMRWTVDTIEDLEFVRLVYRRLYPEDPLFDRFKIFNLLKKEPELSLINAHVKQKEV